MSKFLSNLSTNNVFLDWGVWFVYTQRLIIDFSTGKITLWGTGNSSGSYQYTTMWYMECLGKIFIDKEKRPYDVMAVHSSQHHVIRIENGLKLQPQDINYLFSHIELYGASTHPNTHTEDYDFYHLPTPSEPWLEVHKHKIYSDPLSVRKRVYARYKP